MSTPADMIQALHEFVGDWNVSQQIWTSPGAEPENHRGKTKCTALLGGVATLMVTEMETSGFKGVALITYNPKLERYQMSFLDSLSDEGISVMHGQHKPEPSREQLRHAFGKTATQIREWTVGGPPPEAEPSAREAELSAEVAVDVVGACLPKNEANGAQMSFRMVENKISKDHWVLEFFLGDSKGEFLAQQNSFTRATD